MTPVEGSTGVGWAAETDGNPSAAISSAAPLKPGIYDLAQNHLLIDGVSPRATKYQFGLPGASCPSRDGHATSTIHYMLASVRKASDFVPQGWAGNTIRLGRLAWLGESVNLGEHGNVVER